VRFKLIFLHLYEQAVGTQTLKTE